LQINYKFSHYLIAKLGEYGRIDTDIEFLIGGWCIVIDFKEEISKYKPVRTVDEIEEGIKDEVQDILDLLQYISGKTSGKDVNRL